MRHYALQLLISLSQCLNALLAGWPDETVSSRAWRLEDASRCWALLRWLIDTAFRPLGQPDHCFEAYVNERLRTQWPPELRRGALHEMTD